MLEGKLLTSRSGYDVVVASNFSLPTLIKAGALAPLPRDQLPGWKNLDSDLLSKLANNDPAINTPCLICGHQRHRLQRRQGARRARRQGAAGFLDLVFKEENLARLGQCGVAMLDSPSEMLPVALHYIGLPPNSTNPEDYQKAEALLLKLRPHIAYFNSSKFISDLSNGNICVAVGWSGAMLEAKTNAEQANNGVKIAYSLPKEGAPVWFDTLVLLKDAPNRTQGLAFIDYLLRPEVIAPVSDHLSYPNGNRAATPLVAAATRDNPAVYPSAAAMATLYTLEPLPKATERVRTRVWSKVKNGQ